MDDERVVLRLPDRGGDRRARPEDFVAGRRRDGRDELQRRRSDVGVRPLRERQHRGETLARRSGLTEREGVRDKRSELVDVGVAREGALDRSKRAVRVAEELERHRREREGDPSSLRPVEGVADDAGGLGDVELQHGAVVPREVERGPDGAAEGLDDGDARRSDQGADEHVDLPPDALLVVSCEAGGA